MIGTLRDWWCKRFHRVIMWPIHGGYACAVCGRWYPFLRETEDRR